MLVLRKNANETWLQAALRQAARYGLEDEVRMAYEAAMNILGTDEADAALCACMDWDICDFEASPEEQTMLARRVNRETTPIPWQPCEDL